MIVKIPLASSLLPDWIRKAALALNLLIGFENRRQNITVVSETYTIKDSDHIILVNGAYAVTLAGGEVGRQVIIKDAAGTAGTAGFTVYGQIDGATRKNIITNYGVMQLVKTENGWVEI